MYKITDADKANFKGIFWDLTPSSAQTTLVFVPPSGAPDTSSAPARYKGRITWTGDLSKSVASFVLLNVTSGDEEEYGIRIKFGLFDVLKDTVDLKVLCKYTCPHVVGSCVLLKSLQRQHTTDEIPRIYIQSHACSFLLQKAIPEYLQVCAHLAILITSLWQGEFPGMVTFPVRLV